MANYELKTDGHSSHQQIASFIKKKYPSKCKVLDLGCDVGFLGQLLTRISKNPTSQPKSRTLHLDGYFFLIKDERLQLAKHYYQTTYCFDLNNRNWPIHKKYDLIVIADTLEHLIQPREIILKSIKLIKPGGILIISIPNSVFWYARLLILSGTFPKHDRGIFDKTHLQFYTFTTFTSMLDSVQNLRITDRFQTVPPFQFLPAINWLKPLIRLFSETAYVTAKLWPNLCAYQHILVVRVNPNHSASK